MIAYKLCISDLVSLDLHMIQLEGDIKELFPKFKRITISYEPKQHIMITFEYINVEYYTKVEDFILYFKQHKMTSTPNPHWRKL